MVNKHVLTQVRVWIISHNQWPPTVPRDTLTSDPEVSYFREAVHPGNMSTDHHRHTMTPETGISIVHGQFAGVHNSMRGTRVLCTVLALVFHKKSFKTSEVGIQLSVIKPYLFVGKLESIILEHGKIAN